MDYTKIKFRDNVVDANLEKLEMNCIQFCALFLAEKYKLRKPVFPSRIYPLQWSQYSEPVLINSIKEFLINNNIKIKRIYLQCKKMLPNDTIIILKFPGNKHLHHAGIIQDGHVLHCKPPNGFSKSVFFPKIFERGAVALEVELWD